MTCPHCKAALPDGARFCSSCGAASEPAAAPGEPFETCEIALWRGYVKSRFYVVGEPTLPENAEPLASPLFRSRGEPTDEGAAADAYKVLVSELLAEGWEPTERRRAWYSQRFVRRTRALAAATATAPTVEPAPRVDPEPPLETDPHVEAVPEAPAVEVHLGTSEDATTETPRPPAEDDDGEWRETEVVGSEGKKMKKQRIRVGSVLLFTLTVGVAAAMAPSLMRSDTAKGVTRERSAAQVKSRQPAVRKPASPKPVVKPRVAHVVISATRGDSWIEARSGSANASVLYSGVLRQGETTRVSRPVVWLRLAAAANVDVLVNGHPPAKGPLLGTVVVLLRAAS
jgi:hypothetical protein